MSAYGGSNAQSIKDGIDPVFKNESPLQVDGFLNKLIGATSDGASVNFGQHGGVMCKLELDGHPWLIKFHCVNHKTELAVKDTFANSPFDVVDRF